MSRRSKQPVADPMAAYDLSVGGIPDEWVDAQQASAVGHHARPTSPGAARFRVVPEAQESPFITNLVAFGAGFAVVAAWFFLETLSIYRGPWTPVAAGAVVGLAVRVAGIPDRNYRLIVSEGAFVLAVVAALTIITHRDLSLIYGSYSLDEFETSLIAGRFGTIGRALAMLAGAVLAPVLAVAGTKRS